MAGAGGGGGGPKIREGEAGDCEPKFCIGAGGGGPRFLEGNTALLNVGFTGNKGLGPGTHTQHTSCKA